MRTQAQKFRLAPTSFFCEECLAKDPQVSQDRHTVDFSEAKEEETECYYCNISGMPRPAEVLFNGFPSCRECRRRRNVVNFVAKANETNQKVIVTQVSMNKEALPTATFHKHNESTQFPKQFNIDPRYASTQDPKTFRDQNVALTRGHNPNLSMALPSSMAYNGSRKRINK